MVLTIGARYRLGPCLLALVVAAISLVAMAGPVSAANPCSLSVNGTPIDSAPGWRDAIEVPYDGTVALAGTAPRGTPIRVQVEIVGLRRTVASFSATGGGFRNQVDIADNAWKGVGLYKVIVDGPCATTFWVKVTGGTFRSTPVALAGVFTLVGLVVLLWGIASRSAMRGVVGGLVAGLGVAVLLQQFGVLPLTVVPLMLATAGGGAVGGLGGLFRRVGARVGGSAGTGGGAGAGGSGSGGIPVPQSPAPPGAPVPQSPWPPAAPAPGTTPRPASVPSPGSAPAPGSVPAPMPTRDEPVIDVRDIPREAYARLDAPPRAVAGTTIDVAVGLRAEATPGVADEPFVIPPHIVGPYELTVDVSGEGFLIDASQSWRVTMPVSASEPYPTRTLQLVVAPVSAPVVPRVVKALYSIGGQTIGMAQRAVIVGRTEADLAAQPDEPVEANVAISVPTTPAPTDLEIRIVRAQGQSSGILWWTFTSPHNLGTALPSAPLVTDVGSEPRQFTRALIEKVAYGEGRQGLLDLLVGLGRRVAREMPDGIWAVLDAVAAAIGGRRPRILLLSEEPYVPWELAIVESPWDPTSSRFLAAQADIGRWVLGERTPKLPPPMALEVASIGVVTGQYGRPGWPRLVEAEQEGSDLVAQFGAVPVDAAYTGVRSLLGGEPRCDVVHFAMHGKWSADGGDEEGLILVDDTVLDADRVLGLDLPTKPLVFLNACQVGAGDQVLGDYAGLAAAFLAAGASAVIAPLWSIDDAIARELVLRFYRDALDGMPIADLLRRERAKIGNDPAIESATLLAYQFYGHPSMKLVRTPSAPGALGQAAESSSETR